MMSEKTTGGTDMGLDYEHAGLVAARRRASRMYKTGHGLNPRPKKTALVAVSICAIMAFGGLLIGVSSDHSNQSIAGSSSTTVSIQNGNFEDPTPASNWSDETPKGYHQAPNWWFLLGYRSWTDGSGNLYPYSRVEYFDSTHGNVLYLDTPNSSVNTEIFFRTISFSFPADAIDMTLHIDAFKFGGSGTSSLITLWVQDSGIGEIYYSATVSPPLDDSWHTYDLSVDPSAAGHDLRVVLWANCSEPGSANSSVYIDNVYLTYDVAIPEFPSAATPVIVLLGTILVIVTRGRRREV